MAGMPPTLIADVICRLLFSVLVWLIAVHFLGWWGVPVALIAGYLSPFRRGRL